MAKENVCEEILLENLEQEIRSTELTENNMPNTLLQPNEERVGITCFMDGTWHKRVSGHIYNSRTGHNFAVGEYTGKIISLVVFSKNCRTHELAEKKGLEPKPHRCARNFPMLNSAKSMEGRGALEHCASIYNRVSSNVKAFVKQIVTDDNSTTRANLLHSIKAKLDLQYVVANGRNLVLGQRRMVEQ